MKPKTKTSNKGPTIWREREMYVSESWSKNGPTTTWERQGEEKPTETKRRENQVKPNPTIHVQKHSPSEIQIKFLWLAWYDTIIIIIIVVVRLGRFVSFIARNKWCVQPFGQTTCRGRGVSFFKAWWLLMQTTQLISSTWLGLSAKFSGLSE